MRQRAVVAGLAVLLVLAPLAARAQERVPNELREKIERSGRVRVLAKLRVETAPEPLLATREAIDRQRAAIGRAQFDVARALGKTKVRRVRNFDAIPYVALEVSRQALAALEASSQVEFVVEDALAAPMLAESTALVAAPPAWSAGYDGAGWSVAVLDTGVDADHAFFGGRVVEEACFSAKGSCPNGQTSQLGAGAAAPCAFASACHHGTHVAGIVAGDGPSYSGVAPGADILAIQVFSRFDGADCGGGASPCALSYTSDQIAALERVYALRNERRIAAVNMSLGGRGYTSQAVCNRENAAQKAIVDTLRAAGIATVIASGNNGYTNAISAPGCISSAVSVGATTKSNAVASYSNSAKFLTLLAPGSAIASSIAGGLYAGMSGTSMAAPHVAGAFALLRDAQPTASVSDVVARLAQTGSAVRDPGNGRVKRSVRVGPAVAGWSVRAKSALRTPDGGDWLVAGAVVPIRWFAAPDAARFDLAWSANRGKTWLPIASGVTGDSYDWTVPATATAQALVRVVPRSAAGKALTGDASNAAFRISLP